MKDKTIYELATRLNQIMIEQQRLEIEYNQIVYELWERIPSLKEDVDIQPKTKMRCKNERDKKIRNAE